MRLKLLIPMVVASLLIVLAGPVQAGLFTGINLADYTSLETASSANLLPTTELSGVLKVGSTNLQDSTGASISYNGTPNITGVFDITTKFILDGSGNQLQEGTGINTGYLMDSTGSVRFTGTAYALFAPTGASGLLGASPAGSMLELYNNSSDPFSGNSYMADVLLAESGSSLGTFGFGSNSTSSPGNWGLAGNGYWYAQLTYGPSTTSPATPAGVSESLTNAVFYGFGLQKLAGPLPINQQVYNDKIGATGLGIPTGTLIGNNQSNGPAILFPSLTNTTNPTPFDLTGGGQSFSGGPSYLPIKSDDPVHVDVAPEPATVAIWGLGAAFLGIAGSIRRRK